MIFLLDSFSPRIPQEQVDRLLRARRRLYSAATMPKGKDDDKEDKKTPDEEEAPAKSRDNNPSCDDNKTSEEQLKSGAQPLKNKTKQRKNAVAALVDTKNAVAAKVSDNEEEEQQQQQKKKDSSARSTTNVKRLDKLKKRMQQSEANKAMKKKEKDAKKKDRSARTKNNSKASSEAPKRTFADKLMSLFGGSRAGKAKTTAEAKSKNNARLRKVADGDEVLPQFGVKVEHDDDCWIEEPGILTDRSHRPDLQLVKNKDNDGQLWHEDKRPFWRNKALQKDVPPTPKTFSQMLIDYINKQTPPQSLPDPADHFDVWMPSEDLVLKDFVWFQDESILANTIGSIICVMDGSERETDVKVPEKEPKSKDDRKVVIKEPATVTSYYRHDNTERETQKFVKSGGGKPKKKKQGSASSSSSSSSTSQSNGADKKGSREGKECAGGGAARAKKK